VSENRIRVRVEPELTPVRLEDKMDLNAEIDVGVDSHLKGLGVVGIVAVALGALCLLIGSMMLGFGYPTPFKGSSADAFHNAYAKSTILFVGVGVLLLFFGTSAFFYGRTVLGSGHLDQFATRDVEVAEGGA